MRFRGLLVIVLMLVSAPAGSLQDRTQMLAIPSSESAVVGVSARYSGSILLFKVGEIQLDALVNEEGYAAASVVEAAGLAALFTDFDIAAEARGVFERAEVSPIRYAHTERIGEKVRNVAVDFRDEVAHPHVQPPFGSLGVPPASTQDRTGVMDPLSAFFEMSRHLAETRGACVGALPIYDGKARYNLRLQALPAEEISTPGWRGEAIVCRSWYEPISGYDPEDYPTEEELSYPLDIWFAPLADGAMHIPVRMHTRAGFGGITVELTEIATNT